MKIKVHFNLKRITWACILLTAVISLNAQPATPTNFLVETVAPPGALSYVIYSWDKTDDALGYGIWARATSVTSNTLAGDIKLFDVNEGPLTVFYSELTNKMLAFEDSVDKALLSECTDGTCIFQLKYEYYLIAYNDEGSGVPASPKYKYTTSNPNALPELTSGNPYSLYPNPGIDFVYLLKGDSPFLGQIMLIDDSGRKVSDLIPDSSGKIDLTMHADGIYYLVIYENGRWIQLPVIKHAN